MIWIISCCHAFSPEHGQEQVEDNKNETNIQVLKIFCMIFWVSWTSIFPLPTFLSLFFLFSFFQGEMTISFWYFIIIFFLNKKKIKSQLLKIFSRSVLIRKRKNKNNINNKKHQQHNGIVSANPNFLKFNVFLLILLWTLESTEGKKL